MDSIDVCVIGLNFSMDFELSQEGLETTTDRSCRVRRMEWVNAEPRLAAGAGCVEPFIDTPLLALNSPLHESYFICSHPTHDRYHLARYRWTGRLRSSIPCIRVYQSNAIRGEHEQMDANHKKQALRMIPYGLYVLTAESGDGRVVASTVNWLTQASFEPPLVAVGVKADSGAHSISKESGVFALNILGKGQESSAFSFFKSVEREGNSIAGEPFSSGSAGAPIFSNAFGFLECRLVETVERGDHSLFVGEVIDAGISDDLDGRPDDATLTLRDLGEKTFYGG